MSSDTSPSSSPSSQRQLAGSDNPQSMTTVSVGQEKCSEVDSPSSHTVRPKRILPKNLAHLLEPGAEYTPWGDLMWELYGLEDGTLSGGPMPEKVLQNWSEWRDSNLSDPPFHYLLLIRVISQDSLKHHGQSVKTGPVNGSGHSAIRSGLKNWRLSFAMRL